MPYKRGAPKGNRNRRTHGYYSGEAIERRRGADRHNPKVRILLTLERQLAETFAGTGDAWQKDVAARFLRRVALLQESEDLAHRHHH